MASDPKPKPSFAAGYPTDPALDDLVLAFTRGDYARVRAEAPKLADSASDPAVKDAARDLRARIEPDPAALWLLAITGAILVALTAYWIAHGHAPERAPSAAPPASAPPAKTVEHVR